MSAFRNLLAAVRRLFIPFIRVSSNHVFIRDNMISEVQVESNSLWIIR